jgi:hypothetical protein
MRSRIAHHLDFPDYGDGGAEISIAELMLAGQNYPLERRRGGRTPSAEYIAAAEMRQPHFSNARSIRNALDRARLRQANRLVADLAREKLTTLET